MYLNRIWKSCSAEQRKELRNDFELVTNFLSSHMKNEDSDNGKKFVREKNLINAADNIEKTDLNWSKHVFRTDEQGDIIVRSNGKKLYTKPSK